MRFAVHRGLARFAVQRGFARFDVPVRGGLRIEDPGTVTGSSATTVHAGRFVPVRTRHVKIRAKWRFGPVRAEPNRPNGHL